MKISSEHQKICGIDPGCRTFATCYDPTGEIVEISHRRELLDKLNKKMDMLKKKMKDNPLSKKSRCRKSKIVRYEKEKYNQVQELHRQSVNYLVKKYDVIFLGDIESHDIVGGKVNREMNDLNSTSLSKG